MGVGFVAKVEPINCTDIVLRLFVSKGIYKVGLRPYFFTNPTFKIPLKNPTSYLVEAGF